MESALDVLSRAATMVQDNANESRLPAKELPTTAWRRERRLRTGEYHHAAPSHQQHHHPTSSSAATATLSNRSSTPPTTSPPPTAHIQHYPLAVSSSVPIINTHLHSNAQQLTMMMAAAAAAQATMRPLGGETQRPAQHSPPPISNLAGHMHLAPHYPTHPSHIMQDSISAQTIDDDDDVPLDMSVASLKRRSSPPPPYREPLPGSHFASTLPRPSVITQAPPKGEIKDSPLQQLNRENDNRSCESIDEHFRRSLGHDYFALFSKRSPASHLNKPQTTATPLTNHVRSPSPLAMTLTAGASSSLNLNPTDLIPPPAYPSAITISQPQQQPQQNSQPAHQNQANVLIKANSFALNQTSNSGHDSPPLPLVVRPTPQLKHQQQALSLQKSSSLMAMTPLTSPQSPVPITAVKLGSIAHTPIFNTAGPRTNSPLPLKQTQSTVTALVSHSTHVPDNENSPTTSPRHTPPVVNVPVPNQSPNFPAIMRIKTEPGLQTVKTINTTTPPLASTAAAAASSSNYNLNSNSYSSNTPSPSPSSPITSSWKSSNTSQTGNTSADVLASIDDHFAKALGDTWKKLQENKDIGLKKGAPL